MNFLFRLSLTLCLALTTAFAQAGTACNKREATPQEIAQAADTALRVHAALEQRNAPVALVARSGTDLSRYGLHYSHVGFALRDHPQGRWTMVHLLNHCGDDSSALYAQGLVNFFIDDLVNHDARIVWLQPLQAERLAQLLLGSHIKAWHEPRYNLLARPASKRYQNSTAWVLETLALLDADAGIVPRRAQAHALLLAQAFEPDYLRIPYTRRIIGGLFAANVDFTDHPIGTRLSGKYPGVTVRAIFRHLDRRGLIDASIEWRNNRESWSPGPA